MADEKTETTVDSDAASAAMREEANNDKLIAGEFKTTDELVAAYNTLKGAKSDDSSDDKSDEGDEGENTDDAADDAAEEGSEDDAKGAVESAGHDWDALHTEYAEKGELSEDTYASLEKGGIPREMVDTYIRGRQSVVDEYDNAVFEAAGGKEGYEKSLAWAAKNMSAKDKEAFNEAVTSYDKARAVKATEGLAKRYYAIHGKPPERAVRGSSNTTVAVKGFRSQAEAVKAMSDSRYKNDEAYRADVIEQLRVSDVFV